MTPDRGAIAAEYLAILRQVSDGHPHVDAVGIALALALRDQAAAHQREMDELMEQTEREVAALRIELSLQRQIGATASTTESVVAAHANGSARQIHQASPEFWDTPEATSGLDADQADWWIGVSRDRHKWRSLPKSIQLALVRHVLGYVGSGGHISQSTFDNTRPLWMPEAGSHTKTLGMSWMQINDHSADLPGR